MAIGRRVIETIIRAKDETKAAFSKAENRLKRFAATARQFVNLRIVATAAAGTAALNRLANAFDEVGKAAGRLGITSEELSKLQFAAKLAGVDAEVLNNALFRMQRIAGDAAAGIGEAVKTFDRLGLVAEEFITLPFDEQIRQLADALNDIPKGAERASVGAKLFEQQWRQVLDLLSDSQGINDTGEELEALGGVMSDVATKEAAIIADEFTKAWAQVIGIGNSLLELNAKLRNLEFGPGDVGFESGAGKEVDELLEKIVSLKRELDELKDQSPLSGGDLIDLSNIEIEIETAQAKIVDLLGAREEKKALAAREASEREHNKEMAAARDAQTKALAQTIKDRQALLAANLAEAKSYADGQRNLIADINEALNSFSGGGATEYIDVLNKINAAWGALGTGDFSSALAIIASGLETLKNYESTGEDSALSISLLKERFDELAAAASKGSEKEFSKGVADAKDEFEAFKKEVETKPAKLVVIPDPSSGKIIHDQAQKQIDNVGAVNIKVVGVFGGFEGGARANEQDPNDTVTVTELSEKRGFRL